MTDYAGKQLGNYRITRLLGRGGFADVYQGEHIFLKTLVAVKVLQTRISAQDDLENFLKEAQTVARLMHPNIVRVMDFGVTDDTPFLVMDYAPGGTLRQRHPKGLRLNLPTIVPYVKQVADALSYAHSEKLIHRDIKPENMLIGRRNEILLSDFGIALISQSSRYQGTQDVTGTVAYMAPEQIQGRPVRASDQYALGITTYEWLSGDRPFHGSFTELCVQHMFAPPPPLREKVPPISPDVEQVVMTALAKDAKQRFGSVLAFANALAQAAGVSEQSRPPSAPLPPQPSVSIDASAPPVQKPAIPPPPPIEQAAPVMQQAVIPPPPPYVAAESAAADSQPITPVQSTSPVTNPPVAFPPTIPEPSFPATEPVTNGDGAPNKPPAQPVRVAPTVPDLPLIQEKPQIAPTPAKPQIASKPFNAWRIGWVQIIAMVVGMILTAILYNTILPIGSSSFDPFITVALFFAAAFGPWVGLVVAAGGTILGLIIFPSTASPPNIVFSVLLIVAAIGFIAGLAAVLTKGQYRSIGTLTLATIISVGGLIIGLYILFVAEGITPAFLLFIEVNAPFNLILLPIFLFIYDRIAHRKEYART
jgi:serine/threonine protein kinase